ncbi:MAG: hypothetical protein FJ291_08395 [Planctomycetes bacterium]|nr:hypothetical protein [Planctomycetota bacterium]
MVRHILHFVGALGLFSISSAAEPARTIELASSELKTVFLDKAYDPPKHETYIVPGKPSFTVGEYEYCVGSIPDGLHIRHVPSKTFRLLLPFALAESLGAKFVGDGYRPDSPRGLFKAGDYLWMGTNGVGFLRLNTAKQLWSRFDIKDEAVAGHHQSLIYCDDAYLFGEWGWHKRVEAAKPSLHVYSHAKGRWANLVRVTTRNGVFGRAPDGARTSIGWNYSRLAERPYAEVPIMGGAANFPDRIELDGKTGEYVLRFNSSWKEAGVETRLRFLRGELDAHFEQAGNTHSTSPHR